MNEAESSHPASKKRGIVLWPSIIMVALLFGLWVLLYSDIAWYFFVSGFNVFAAVCLVCFLYQMIRLRPKKSVSFLIPVVLVASMGLLFTPRVLFIMVPIERLFFRSRDYVEFLIYEAQHHIRAEVRQNGYRYKEWPLDKHSGTDYGIVYDVTDAIARKDGVVIDTCVNLVISVGGHFYFPRVVCPGIL